MPGYRNAKYHNILYVEMKVSLPEIPRLTACRVITGAVQVIFLLNITIHVPAHQTIVSKE